MVLGYRSGCSRGDDAGLHGDRRIPKLLLDFSIIKLGAKSGQKPFGLVMIKPRTPRRRGASTLEPTQAPAHHPPSRALPVQPIGCHPLGKATRCCSSVSRQTPAFCLRRYRRSSSPAATRNKATRPVQSSALQPSSQRTPHVPVAFTRPRLRAYHQADRPDITANLFRRNFASSILTLRRIPR